MMNCATSFIAVLIGISIQVGLISGGRIPKSLMPLKPAPVQNSIHSKRRIGCYFDQKFFELEEEWHPDLGEPFGLMACIKCKCQPVQKKKKIIGRVTCKNFADMCPKPKCPSPVGGPNECCKVCPDDALHCLEPLELNLFGETPEKGDYVWDSGYTEYMALLTGRFQDPPVLTEGVGRAYLTLYHRNVHYSIKLEKLEETPVGIQIINEKDAVLHEHFLKPSASSNQKICGVWEDLPRLYVRLLRRETLRLVIVTEKQRMGALGGQILRPKGLNKEVFSGLLSPVLSSGARSLGYGGVAVIDVQGGNSLDISIWLNASVDVSQNLNSPIYIHLEKNDGRRKQLKSVQAQLALKDGLLAVETQVRLGSTEQRWLSRGRLLLSLTSQFLVPQEFIAPVTPKQSCDVYQAVLTGEDSGRSGGVAVVEVTEDSSFKYLVRVSDGVKDSELTGISIDRMMRKKNRRRLIAETKEHAEFINGVTKGYFRRQINIRSIDYLFKEKLDLEISHSSTSESSAFRGHLKRVLYSNSVRPDKEEPVLLLPGAATASRVAGVLWAAQPETEEGSGRGAHRGQKEPCRFAYTVHVAGLTEGKPKDLELELCSGTTRKCVHQFDRSLRGESQKIVSQELDFLSIYGRADTLPGAAWKLLDSQNAVFRISTSADEKKSGVLAGNFSVSNSCWKWGFQRDRFVSEDAGANSVVRLECLYQDVTYGDGESWHATHTPCTMCSCQRGKVRCDPVLCPVADCESPVLLPGDCCRTCPLGVSPITGSSQSIGGLADDPGCFWDGDRRWHSPGTAWHPYVPPFGFSKCALCTCQPHTHEISCSRTACPPLPCDPSLEYRDSATDCCLKCKAPLPTTPTTTETPTTPGLAGDDTKGKCYFQKRWIQDGEVFTPSIAHVAHLKCVKCRCRHYVVIRYNVIASGESTMGLVIVNRKTWDHNAAFLQPPDTDIEGESMWGQPLPTEGAEPGTWTGMLHEDATHFFGITHKLVHALDIEPHFIGEYGEEIDDWNQAITIHKYSIPSQGSDIVWRIQSTFRYLHCRRRHTIVSDLCENRSIRFILGDKTPPRTGELPEKFPEIVFSCDQESWTLTEEFVPDPKPVFENQASSQEIYNNACEYFGFSSSRQGRCQYVGDLADTDEYGSESGEPPNHILETVFATHNKEDCQKTDFFSIRHHPKSLLRRSLEALVKMKPEVLHMDEAQLRHIGIPPKMAAVLSEENSRMSQTLSPKVVELL